MAVLCCVLIFVPLCGKGPARQGTGRDGLGLASAGPASASPSGKGEPTICQSDNQYMNTHRNRNNGWEQQAQPHRGNRDIIGKIMRAQGDTPKIGKWVRTDPPGAEIGRKVVESNPLTDTDPLIATIDRVFCFAGSLRPPHRATQGNNRATQGNHRATQGNNSAEIPPNNRPLGPGAHINGPWAI